MAQNDWTAMTNNLDANNVARGVSGAFTGPYGGGTFVFGFHSLAVVTGVVAFFANQTNFAPMANGGSVRGALQRRTSGGDTGWSHYLMIGLQGTDAETDEAYMLGLSDDDPSYIVLRKGLLSDGVQPGSVDPTVNGNLKKSSSSVDLDEWVHLRLDMVVNGTGDVVLKCYQNDLDSYTVSVPTWVAIPGMDDFIDDALEVNTGSAPFTSGRAGFGYTCSDTGRRALIDHVEIARQT